MNKWSFSVIQLLFNLDLSVFSFVVHSVLHHMARIMAALCDVTSDIWRRHQINLCLSLLVIHRHREAVFPQEDACHGVSMLLVFSHKNVPLQTFVSPRWCQEKNKCRFGSLETDLMWKSHLSLGYKVFVQTKDVTYWICVDGRQQGKVPQRRSMIR